MAGCLGVQTLLSSEEKFGRGQTSLGTTSGSGCEQKKKCPR